MLASMRTLERSSDTCRSNVFSVAYWSLSLAYLTNSRPGRDFAQINKVYGTEESWGLTAMVPVCSHTYTHSFLHACMHTWTYIQKKKKHQSRQNQLPSKQWSSHTSVLSLRAAEVPELQEHQHMLTGWSAWCHTEDGLHSDLGFLACLVNLAYPSSIPRLSNKISLLSSCKF